MKPDLQRRIQHYGWDWAAALHYETGWQEQLWPTRKNLLSEVDPQSVLNTRFRGNSAPE